MRTPLAAALLATFLLVAGTGQVLADSWRGTGESAFLRENTASIKLIDGRILVTGSGRLGPEHSTEIYDPSTETWSRTGDTHASIAYHDLTRLTDGAILLTGGYPLTSTVEVWTASSGAWTPVQPMTQARRDHTATLLADGKVLVAGGCGRNSIPCGSDRLDKAEIYDPTLNVWKQVAPLHHARYLHHAVLLDDGTVLVAGGAGLDDRSLASAEVYDPIANAWTEVGDMVAERGYFTLTKLSDGRAMAAGGFDRQLRRNASVEIYDPTSQAWTYTGALTISRFGHTATLLSDGRVLVTGGEDSCLSTQPSSAELWTDGNWTVTPLMLRCRIFHGAERLDDGRVLVFGGMRFTEQHPNAEIYTP